MESTVYFTDARSRRREESMVRKIAKLFEKSGLSSRIPNGGNVLIKVHWGSPGCTRYLRPIYVAKIVEKVKECGGVPCVCETVGAGPPHSPRSSSGYLLTAYKHGYTPEVLGCPIILADGFVGESVKIVEVPEGQELKRAYVAKAIAEADFLIVLSHFKGHGSSGFGGAIKNLGIGCVNKTGKNLAHNLSKPKVDPNMCDGCGECLEVCDVAAISMVSGKAVIDEEKCWFCRACIEMCRKHFNDPKKSAIIVEWVQDSPTFQRRLVDQAAGVMKLLRGRIYFFNFIMDVTPLCDCAPFSDVPIVPDIGVAASEDPVAIDQASLDLVNQAPGIPGSAAEEVGALAPGTDKFGLIHPHTKGGLPQLEAAEKLGLGVRKYRLVRID